MKPRKPFLMALASALLLAAIVVPTYAQQSAYYMQLVVGAIFGAPAAANLAPTGGLPFSSGSANTNGAGANLTLGGGQGLGNATPNGTNGSIVLQSSKPGSSGTTPETYQTIAVVDTHLNAKGYTPTISSGFGTSPAITRGTDNGFVVNVGTGGSATSGVVAFGQAYTAAPTCTVTDETAEAVITSSVATTTTLTISGYYGTAAAAWGSATKLDVVCFGT